MKLIRRSTIIASAVALIGALTAPVAQSEDIKLRIASGHPAANTYVNLMQNFFVPEVTKRVAARTKHKVEFIEGYGGAMVKTADTLEGVQSGIIDIGGYCFCFEPSNLPLHAFQVMLPFGTMDPETSVKLARAVYDKVPYMSKVFEDKFKQKLLGLIADYDKMARMIDQKQSNVVPFRTGANASAQDAIERTRAAATECARDALYR